MREIKKIIVHCSDSEQFKQNGEAIDAADINEWHLKRGWSGIGYHYVITGTGELQPGRDIAEAGAHCKGHNSDSIGICLVGRNTFYVRQIRTLVETLQMLMLQHGLTRDDIYGHRDFTSEKTCPNFAVSDIITIMYPDVRL